MLEFTIEGKPQAKQSARFFIRKSGYIGSCQPEKVTNYANWVKLCFQREYLTWQPYSVEIPLRVNITAYFPIPTSKPKKWKEQAREGKIRPTVKPDNDNLLKLLNDALNGLAWEDDRQIVEENIKKFYSDRPRVEVQIEGIW